VTLAEQKREQADNVIWQPVGDATGLSIDAHLRDLVSVTGSLTRCLRDLCSGAFSLRLLGERNEVEQGLVREVLMLCSDLPWVFAQTVIPQSTLAGNPWIRDLGDRPLGDTLFDRPGVVRSNLNLTRLRRGHHLYDRAVRDAGLAGFPESLLARRSIVRIVDTELTINEVFLPDAGYCQPR